MEHRLQKLSILVIMALVLGCLPSVAQDGTETVFAYASKTDRSDGSGTGLHETYDVAIGLTNEALVGKTITAVEIPVYGSKYISNLSIWIADNLTIELVNGKNTNIVDRRFELEYPTEDGIQWVKYDLDEPYVIPQGGTHVGYSLTVNELKNFHPETYAPLLCGFASKQGGLFLHTSRSFLDWQDRSELLSCVAMTQVYIGGEFMVDAVSMAEVEFQYLCDDGVQQVNVPLHNIGLNPISSIEYTSTTSEGSTLNGKLEFEEPIPAVFAFRQEALLDIPEFENLGEVTVTITIDRVNGNPNDYKEATTTFNAKVLDFVPKHLALMEEYTGTWCGWCSRGYVAMELMREMFPDFVGIAYHNADPMELAEGYPRLTTGAPAATVNRVLSCDPFYAKGSNNGFKMPEVYAEYCKGFVPVGIEVEATLNENGIVDIESYTTWADDAEPGNYAIEYVLVGDDVYDIPGTGNPFTWMQHNYYAKEPVEEYLEWICSQPEYIQGLHFNDVALLTSGLHGVEGSIVDTTVGYVNHHTYSFDTSKAVTPVSNSMGIQTGTIAIPFHNDKLRVVAMLLDRADTTTLGSIYGRVVNVTQCHVSTEPAGITSTTTDNLPVVSATYYDLRGVQIPTPTQAGIYLKNVRYSDGTTTTVKEVIK